MRKILFLDSSCYDAGFEVFWKNGNAGSIGRLAMIIVITTVPATNTARKFIVVNPIAARSVARGYRPREGDGIHSRLPTWVAGGAVSDARFIILYQVSLNTCTFINPPAFVIMSDTGDAR